MSSTVLAELPGSQGSDIVSPNGATAEVWFYLADDPISGTGRIQWHRAYHHGTLSLDETHLALRDDNKELLWQIRLTDLSRVRVISTVMTLWFQDGAKYDLDFRDGRAAARWAKSPFYLKGVGPALTSMEPFVDAFRQRNLLRAMSWVAPALWLLGLFTLCVVVGIALS